MIKNKFFLETKHIRIGTNASPSLHIQEKKCTISTESEETTSSGQNPPNSPAKNTSVGSTIKRCCLTETGEKNIKKGQQKFWRYLGGSKRKS